MVVSGRRHSISDTVVVAAAASGRRRRRPADLLSVVVVGQDLLGDGLGGDPPGGGCGGGGGPPLLPLSLTSKFLNIAFTLLRVAIRFQTGFLLIRARACASTSPFNNCINLFDLM